MHTSLSHPSLSLNHLTLLCPETWLLPQHLSRFTISSQHPACEYSNINRVDGELITLAEKIQTDYTITRQTKVLDQWESK
jgi:hypothetical protein